MSFRDFLGPKSTYWKPSVTRSFYRFKYLAREETFTVDAVGGPPSSIPPVGGVDQVGYPALVPVTEGESFPRFSMPILGLPQRPLYLTGATPPSEHWNLAKSIFYKSITPTFSFQYSIRLNCIPNRTLTSGGPASTASAVSLRYHLASSTLKHPPRALIVIERSLVNQPTEAELKANCIPFGRSGTPTLRTNAQIFNDDSFRHFLKNKDPRLIYFAVVDFKRTYTGPMQQGSLSAEAVGMSTITPDGVLFTTPIFTATAWASDPSFGDVPVNNHADMISYFQDPQNYPVTNSGTVALMMPTAQQPIFYRVFDISNQNDWFAPAPGFAVTGQNFTPQPDFYISQRCDQVRMSMDTTMFMNVDVLQEAFMMNQEDNVDHEVGLAPPTDCEDLPSYSTQGVPIIPPA